MMESHLTPSGDGLRIDGEHARAIDQAVELLGAVLRAEAQSAAERRAQLLRGRLSNAGHEALRERIELQGRRG